MLRKIFLTPLIIGCSTLVATEFETVITAERSEVTRDAEKVENSAEKSTPGYPWLSLAQAGLQAAPTAGALSPGSITYRGYSAPQLRVMLDGFDLADVGTGLFNPHDLPLFGTDHFEFTPGVADNGLGASLKLQLQVPRKFKAKARGSFGSHGFALMDTVAATGDLSGSRALLGVQLASSRGDFEVSTGPRLNNDQSRMLGFLKSEHSFKHADLDFLLFARQQEGGLAGPDTFPTPNARLFSQKALLGTSLSWEIGTFPMSVKWQTRYDRNESTHEGRVDNVEFFDNALSFNVERKLELADTYSGLESTIGESQVLDGRFRRLWTRHQMSFDTAPFSFWGLRFKRSFGVDVYSDIGWFLNFRTHITSKPFDHFTFGLRFGRNSRVPTLSEMYAPAGLILGNANLEPEKIHDTTAYVRFELNKKLDVSVDFFYASMSKAIFYVNRNSNVVEPINADHVDRIGVGASLSYQPSDVFEMRTRGDWLYTRVQESAAPLPGATPLAISLDSRIGKEAGIFGRFNLIANAGSSSNLFGTLTTPAYVLVNTSLHVPLSDFARVIFSATNLANVTWAKTAYHYPMPGREFFITFEVFS